MFKADWGGTSKADNLKIDEIVTMSDTYEEAEYHCEVAFLNNQIEDFDTIIRDKLTSYYNPEVKTYGELRRSLN